MGSPGERTIRDFGEQWAHYGANEGFYASLDLLRDAFGPLLSVDELRGLRAADVGSGTGRIVAMLLEAGAAHVVALEPSDAVATLRENVRPFGDRVEVIQGRGEELPPRGDRDVVTAIGVVQFIPDPLPTLKAALEALRPGGRLVLWVYAREGNAPYLLLLRALRAVTTRLPHRALVAVCAALNAGLDLYIAACRRVALPMRDYALGVLARLERKQRELVIYDQLNPSFVHFYTRDELRALLEAAGFRDVQLHHRRGYSWTALGVRPG